MSLAAMVSTAGRKLFVGSLPFGIQDSQLRAEFSRFGQVEDVFIKPVSDPSKQWAFITMAAPDQAQTAKEQSDRILMFPGAERPCDVMVAKNQGMFGQSGETPPPVQAGFGLNDPNAGLHHGGGGLHTDQQQSFSSVAPMKIFVGSLPDGIDDSSLRLEFSKYGNVTDIFIKPGCEPGRQWAFVSFQSSEEAEYAQQCTNGLLQFAGQLRGCEVTMARNQGMFGKDAIAAGPPRGQHQQQSSVTENMMAPKKVFVGSLPATITDAQLQAEFSKYGQILDIHLNNRNVDSGRQWAFVTFASADQANLCKVSCDRVLMFPGAEKPCEVTLARHQGMFGQESIVQDTPVYSPQVVHAVPAAAPSSSQPKKIFVGSLPDTITDQILRSEFSRYGQVIDVFVSDKPCEPGRNWAFVTFANMEQAQYAKDSTDRVLVMPGADRACEVMLAKNQGKFGQDSVSGAPPAVAARGPQVVHAPALGPPGAQPPPPSAPAPAHLTTWRMYKTAAGLPYYHNSATQVTQWECPPELQVPGQASVYSLPQAPAATGKAAGKGARYAPY